MSYFFVYYWFILYYNSNYLYNLWGNLVKYMKIELNEVRKLNANEIYDLINVFINEMYDSFIFCILTRVEFDKLVLDEIKKSKKNFDGTIEYIKYFMGCISHCI